MTSARPAHSDQNRFAFLCETNANQMGLWVPSIDLSAQYAVELFPTQSLQRFVAGLVLKPLFGRALQPL
jgi:hypothetical protein